MATSLCRVSKFDLKDTKESCLSEEDLLCSSFTLQKKKKRKETGLKGRNVLPLPYFPVSPMLSLNQSSKLEKARSQALLQRAAVHKERFYSESIIMND